MRLIDADALKDRFSLTGPIGISVRKVIDAAPSIDAVPVVRCGNCERRNKSADLTDTIYCPWLNLQMRKGDYCSYGERKDGEGK